MLWRNGCCTAAKLFTTGRIACPKTLRDAHGVPKDSRFPLRVVLTRWRYTCSISSASSNWFGSRLCARCAQPAASSRRPAYTALQSARLCAGCGDSIASGVAISLKGSVVLGMAKVCHSGRAHAPQTPNPGILPQGRAGYFTVSGTLAAMARTCRQSSPADNASNCAWLIDTRRNEHINLTAFSLMP